jgi:hypothetical protein
MEGIANVFAPAKLRALSRLPIRNPLVIDKEADIPENHDQQQ